MKNNTNQQISILIVDDRPENLFSLETILKQSHLNIVKAASGQEALRQVLKHDIALILLDVQMPEMDGFETAALIRCNENTQYIPIIFLTAINKEDRHIFKGYDSGAVDYIFKPLDPGILKSKVNVFLEIYNQKKLIEDQNKTLKYYQKNLEDLVEKRTSELKKSEKQLKQKTTNLKEMNTALKILFQQKEDNIDELQEQFLSNIKQLVLPYVEKIKKTHLKDEQSALIELIEGNLKNIISPFIKRISSQYLGLSPKELQVSSLIKDGKTHKEIAEILNVSENTILFHRSNIRKKLNLKNRKINLRSYLLSMDNQ
jgi:response regulator RpfG family c-di-GMP phosphodiesterase/DNA-binding CsgD family transcriptional regulator